jgi:hypothetical protein
MCVATTEVASHRIRSTPDDRQLPINDSTRSHRPSMGGAIGVIGVSRTADRSIQTGHHPNREESHQGCRAPHNCERNETPLRREKPQVAPDRAVAYQEAHGLLAHTLYEVEPGS